jgi:hypothetical protein
MSGLASLPFLACQRIQATLLLVLIMGTKSYKYRYVLRILCDASRQQFHSRNHLRYLTCWRDDCTARLHCSTMTVSYTGANIRSIAFQFCPFRTPYKIGRLQKRRNGRCDRRHVIQYGAAEFATHEMLLRTWWEDISSPRDFCLNYTYEYESTSPH